MVSDLYFVQNKTLHEIGEQYGVHRETVARFLRKNGFRIKTRREVRIGQKHSMETRKKMSDSSSKEKHFMWIDLDKDYIDFLYWEKGRSQSNIARFLNISQHKICSFMRYHNIKRRTNSEANIGERHRFYGKHHTEESRRRISEVKKAQDLGVKLDKDLIHKLYWEESLSHRKIGKKFGVSRETIRLFMNTNNIPIKDANSTGKDSYHYIHLDKEVVYDLFWRHGKSVKKVSNELGVSKSKIYLFLSENNIGEKDFLDYKLLADCNIFLEEKKCSPYKTEFNEKFKKQIRDRDKNTCQTCRTHQNELKRQLSCHHIDYNKINNNMKNLISLCVKCHAKTNINRDYWENRLTNYMKSRQDLLQTQYKKPVSQENQTPKYILVPHNE